MTKRKAVPKFDIYSKAKKRDDEGLLEHESKKAFEVGNLED